MTRSLAGSDYRQGTLDPRIGSKPAPVKSAPVEIMFSPNVDLPVVPITNMLEGTLWAGVWDPKNKVFSFHQIDDFGSRQQGMPREMLYNAKGDCLFVTTAKPGFVNLYDNGDPRQPKLPKTIAAAAGAPIACCRPINGTSVSRTVCSIWRG